MEPSRAMEPVGRCGITPAQIASFRGALRSFFGRRVRQSDEVEDLVQETLTRLFASARDLELREPQAYLFRIAANLLADRHRRSRSPLADARPFDEADAPPVAADQEDGRRYRDLQGLLESALSELPPRCRNVFIMRRFREMDSIDIARTLGISQRMVQKYLVRAATHLYARLGPVLENEA